MTISTNDAVGKFDTLSTTITTTGALTAGSFSSTAETTIVTNTNDCRSAEAVFKGTFAATVIAGEVVNLYARRMNIAGAGEHASIPDGNYPHEFVGSFICNDDSVTQIIPRTIPMPMSKSGQQLEFYIKNSTGQTLNAGATVTIQPTTTGPKA